MTSEGTSIMISLYEGVAESNLRSGPGHVMEQSLLHRVARILIVLLSP